MPWHSVLSWQEGQILYTGEYQHWGAPYSTACNCSANQTSSTLTHLTGFKPHNSFHLYIPIPGLSYLILEDLFFWQYIQRYPALSLPTVDSYLAVHQPIRWPMTTALSEGSKAQVAHAVSAMPPSQRKIQRVLIALHISTQALNSCGLPSVLCSTSSYKFIFLAPPCQHHSVLTEAPFLTVMTVSTIAAATLQSQPSEPLANISLV